MQLDEEDKNWIASAIASALRESEGRIAARLEQRFVAAIRESEARTAANMESRLMAALRESEERTAARLEKQFMAALRESEERTAADMETRLIAAIRESEARTAATIEATETRLLTAFHQWASPVETRVRSLGLAIRAVDQETETNIERDKKIADLMRRVSDLEKAS
jgi:type I site-specific restriction endonuclease